MSFSYRVVTVQGRVYKLLVLPPVQFPCNVSKVLRAALASRRRDGDKDQTIYYWIIFHDSHGQEIVYKLTQAELKEELGRRNKAAKSI